MWLNARRIVLFFQDFSLLLNPADIDLQSAKGSYEFSCILRSLFSSDGSLLAGRDEHKLMAILEASSRDENGPKSFSVYEENDDVDAQIRSLIIDGIAIVQDVLSISVKIC